MVSAYGSMIVTSSLQVLSAPTRGAGKFKGSLLALCEHHEMARID